MGRAKIVRLCDRMKLFALRTFQFIIGFLLTIPLALFILLSSPVYLFRWVMTRFSKYFRPDLGSPMNPGSSGLVQDIYSSTKPPRGNTVFSLMFDGDLDPAQFGKLVLDKWVYAKGSEVGEELKFPQFTQFSVSWWGFMFWKLDGNFDIHNHIHFHPNPNGLEDSELDQAKEELLNAPHPPNRSPWELHIFNNYRNLEIHPGAMSVVLLKFHHSFTDGYGMLHAVAEDLLGGSLGPLPKAINAPKTSFWEGAVVSLMTPVNICVELTRMGWDVLLVRVNKPLQVPDRKKAWHQLYAQSKLIPLKQLKQIKNNFGVSFTTVIISGISAGLHKALERKRKDDQNQMRHTGSGKEISSTYFLNAMPLPPETRKERLTNHLTAGVFHLPTGSFPNPVDRMFECSRVLEEGQRSIIRQICSTFVNVGGSHFRWLLKFCMGYFVTIPTGLSNFPSVGEGFVGSATGKRLIFLEAVTGCQFGVAGIIFVMTSSFGQSRIAVSAEKAVFSREELHELLKVVEEEIDSLYELSMVDKESRK